MIKTFAAIVLFTATAVASESQRQPSPPRPVIGSFGLDLSAGDPEVKPGDDFFAYANGRWLRSFEIPQDRASFGPSQQLAATAQRQVRAIIEQSAASRAAQGSPEQKIGDYYEAFMDEAAIEAKGLEPAQPYLKRIQAAASKQDVAALFGNKAFASPIWIAITPDAKNPKRYAVVINQSRLGLPDREYYLKDDAGIEQIRTQYLAYIEQMLAMTGASDAKSDARRVMEFETAVAEVQWPMEKLRDVLANYNAMDRKQLLELAPKFAWQAFLEAAELGSRQAFVIGQPDAIRNVAELLERTPLDTLKSFLVFRFLNDNARYLPKRFNEAAFAFNGGILQGQPAQTDRWKRGVDEVIVALNEQVGQVYVARHFAPESKAKMQTLVANLRAAMDERLTTLDWMSLQTKQKAREKLSTFVAKIGYPDTWRDYSTLEVRRGDLFGNVRRARLWEWRRNVVRVDQPVDTKEWGLGPHMVNAYYNPPLNEIVFPAAILQPPFFDPNADAAVNYGAIGAVIGHEIGHGFDDQGRRFAADGTLSDWWTAEDSEAFNRRTALLVRQYSEFEALPGIRVNGARTLGENIGDLGGLNIAYRAYRLSLAGREAPVIEGLTGDQRFFLSWAQVWRAKFREAALRRQVMTEYHSPARFRVNGPLRNMDAWYAAFNIQPEDALYLKPQDRVTIW